MFCDYHIHTAYSDDSIYPMEQVILDAIQMGIQEICFTDHVDYGIKRDFDDPRGILTRKGGKNEPEIMNIANVDYPRYVKEIAELSQKYQDKISVKMGLEFGIQPHTIPLYKTLFNRYPWDFIILSIHEIDDKEFWTQDFQKGKTQEEYNKRYYESMLEIVETYNDYSVLGHLDLITRYDKAGIYPFENVKNIVTKILETVIRNGKGIEVNTSSFRYGLRDLTPGKEILALYKKLGGKILTIGSDSHKPEHLGTHIQDVKATLLQMGFTEFCTFNKMEASFVKIV